jgi:hypothetical protein
VKGWNNIEVVFDAPKIAVLVGTTGGFQLLAVLKLFEPGLSSQVASCARAGIAVSNATAAAVVSKYVRIAPPTSAAAVAITLALGASVTEPGCQSTGFSRGGRQGRSRRRYMQLHLDLPLPNRYPTLSTRKARIWCTRWRLWRYFRAHKANYYDCDISITQPGRRPPVTQPVGIN